MCKSFVHLHNHTEYSLLDGANKIPELVARAKSLGQESLAITDHGVMFGAMEFNFECRKQGIKPILGMEAYVAPNGHLLREGRQENQTYHLLLLAKNLEGYRNLCRLHTIAALQGFYYKPRIDHELLREHARGLIGSTTCLGSEVNQLLLEDRYDEAKERAAMYRDIFDEGSYFVELQDHRLPEQHKCNEGLIKIAHELKLPLVATNDAHYLCRESNAAHDVLLCIGTGAMLNDTKRLKFSTDEFYIKSGEEMAALFPDHPEAIENTAMFAEMCDVDLGKMRAPMPQPKLEGGMDSSGYLRHLAEEGLKTRVETLNDEAWERLNYELQVIESTKFEDYFLLVREFANFTRESGIAYGVRGSAAGSLISFCIGITDVDPLKYDLTFERFLNPERISMPDIDMDFEDARRQEVIDYVVQRFGQDHVAQIITFGTLGARAAIKDAGRVMGYAPQDTDRICKTIPNIPGMTLTKAQKESNEFRDMVQNDPSVSRLVDVAKEIEGTARHAGVHAAGVVISGDPLAEYIPLYRSADGMPVTGFEMGILEKIGMLKMDFLGLSNLTVLARASEYIELTTGKAIDATKMPLDDAPTFEMLSRGETIGVFQLESGGMRRNIIELKPRSVQELAAMVALYRPGPMEHIPRYVDTKFGRRQADYLHPSMEPVLSETYGVIVYQDQVLKLVQAMAGFSLGKADVLRRAMGKKDIDAMKQMRVEFMDGAAARDIPAEAAAQVWELLLPFAGYAFNKAHAVCYALLAYQTAWLKAHYPVEYMAALLSVYSDKEDRVTAFVEESRRQGISVLPPDINLSRSAFSIEQVVNTKKKKEAPKAVIRFGLAAIKGVGVGLVQAILGERDENGPFNHLYDFCERTKAFGLNRGALESLIKAGALTSIDTNRRKLMASVEVALSYAENALRDKEAGQDSLFGEPEPTTTGGSSHPPLPDQDPYGRAEILALEREVMGVYVSDHPLRGLENVLPTLSSHNTGQLGDLDDTAPVKFAGIITGLSVRTTKSGEKMASFLIEDFHGQAPCLVFAKTYAKLRDQIVKDALVVVRGALTVRERFGNSAEKQLEIRVEDISPLEHAPDVQMEHGDQEVGQVRIRIRRARPDQLRELREVIRAIPGDYAVVLQVGDIGAYAPIVLQSRIDGALRDLGKRVGNCIPGALLEVQENQFKAPDETRPFAPSEGDEDAPFDLGPSAAGS
ncbi:MAG: DNA polymerase III subunit alpha [Chthonomonas sp.]|nr:DNA polymerase III subunit alpha [Chthonomonas sp.]